MRMATVSHNQTVGMNEEKTVGMLGAAVAAVARCELAAYQSSCQACKQHAQQRLQPACSLPSDAALENVQ